MKTKRMMNLKDRNQLPHSPGDSLSHASLGVLDVGGEFCLYVFILGVHFKDGLRAFFNL